jgi:hypothetical protein
LQISQQKQALGIQAGRANRSDFVYKSGIELKLVANATLRRAAIKQAAWRRFRGFRLQIGNPTLSTKTSFTSPKMA